MAQPPAVDQIAEQLTGAYRGAWERILAAQQQLADDPGLWRQRRRLNELQREIGRLLDDVDGQARRWLSRRYPDVYALGAAQDATPARPFAWSQTHVDAVTELANDTFDDLLAATRFVRSTTKTLIRTLARQQALAATLEGQTARQAARGLTQLLDRHRIVAVIYSDGSRHGLAEYAELTIRAKTAVAYNAGTLGQLQSAGTGWVEVFDGADCGWGSHDDADKANGTIRTVSDAAAHPIAHPNCRRSFGGRPDIRTGDQAATAGPSTTAAQRQDAADFERARVGAVEQRRRRAARQPRATRATRTARTVRGA